MGKSTAQDRRGGRGTAYVQRQTARKLIEEVIRELGKVKGAAAQVEKLRDALALMIGD